MSFNAELWRTEQLYAVRSKGTLHDGGEVVVGNAGIAAKYNPTPSILDHLLSRPCAENMMLARFTLSTHFVKIGLCTNRDSTDVANDVLAWFLDPVCHACHGTGVKNKEQETCHVCGGVEKRPTWEPARKGVAEIESLFMWREVQLRKRNRS